MRAIENDDDYRKQNFAIPPMPRVMDPNSLPAEKIGRRFISFQSCYVCTIENDDECREQNFSFLPVTRVMDLLNSLPAEKSFGDIFFSFKSGCERCSKI